MNTPTSTDIDPQSTQTSKEESHAVGDLTIEDDSNVGYEKDSHVETLINGVVDTIREELTAMYSVMDYAVMKVDDITISERLSDAQIEKFVQVNIAMVIDIMARHHKALRRKFCPLISSKSYMDFQIMLDESRLAHEDRVLIRV